MLRKLNKDNKGFTIIEIMIVLAIAGLIMLIVFLAVPALQRNQRNTNRKSDVGRIASSVITLLANNNGQPLGVTAADATRVISDVGTMNGYPPLTGLLGVANGPMTAMANDRLAIVTFDAAADIQTLPVGATSSNQVVIVQNGNCITSGANAGGAGFASNARAVAVVYTLEGGTAHTGSCQEIQS